MDQIRRRRFGWVLAGLAAGATSAAMALDVRRLLQVLGSPTPVDPRELITLLLATAALTVAGWLALTTAVALLAHLPGLPGRLAGRLGAAVTPAGSRRVAAFLLGVSLGAAGAPSSSAASPGPSPVAAVLATPGWAPSGSGPSVPEPGWTPPRPLVRPQPEAGLLLSAAPAGDGEVVVLRGDTLWSIAAQALGAGATDAEVAAAWPRWHAVNREVIGADPDLLLPGQVLHAPGSGR